LVLAEDGTTHWQGTPARLSPELSEQKSSQKANVQVDAVESENSAAPAAEDEPSESQTDGLARQTGDWEVYVYYLKTWGVLTAVFFNISLAVVAFGIKFPVVWLGWWSQEEAVKPGERTGYYMSFMFAFATSGLLGLVLSVGTLFVVIVPAVGTKIHRNLLNSAMHAPYFFSALTDVGTTLNR
jgi:ATP-binding cassette subfamily C (CFTR/MRP) protein 1